MKAIVQELYGSPLEVLSHRDVDRPEPGPDEILIRVRAAAVNARDWHIMRGDPRVARLMLPSVFGRRGPRCSIRGSDVAGTVDAPQQHGGGFGAEVVDRAHARAYKRFGVSLFEALDCHEFADALPRFDDVTRHVGRAGHEDGVRAPEGPCILDPGAF